MMITTIFLWIGATPVVLVLGEIGSALNRIAIALEKGK